ncbi:gliding motility lipoprotein GldB [Mucilaginibacter sp. X4EP1]|uniref:gliding motility lipoprotein GldB n=1 Tax=Mucilaginibacter sp. X4EP1 TaxID=2723092 RepID=UPI002169741F|nr:gliding motility lipoprotein GldB [Mucilaginibacter sp. X4EP1]MCS3813670.1 gliding motility-associated lipoprotein GldB [Mucilaginibacter sp. X4EP1]
MIILNKTKQIYLFFLISLLLAACGHSKKVDVSNIPVDVKIERFDKEFDSLRTGPMAPRAAYLQKKYGAFYQDYVALLIQDQDISTKDTAYFNLLRQVFATSAYNDLKHDVDSVYPNIEKPQADLTDAFRHIKYYFPDKKLPKVYAFFSGFEAQTTVGDSYVGIGLDLFLGENSRFYPALTKNFPHYLSRNFNALNITPRVIEGMAREDMFPEGDSSKTLLSKMIYNGKIMYYMDQIMPDLNDTTKIGYTGAQLKWCQQFESSIWAYFLNENLLYETDYLKLQKYLTEAPFTPGLGEKNESAPKLAVWTGWQIVRKYMEKHPEVTLPQLMASTDAQKILNEANYKPK